MAIGVYGFPEVLLGGMAGFGLGGIAPRRIANRSTRRELREVGAWSILAGLAIGGLYFALRGPLGLEVEVRGFHGAWKSEGIDAGALVEYPWGWLPQAAALALFVAGLLLIWRTRR